jgi:hypothetical protein
MAIKKSRSALAALFLLAAGIGTSEATLLDRGGGLIYDDALDITWMQDAQYVLTSGHSSTGRLNWNAAVDFASQVEYYDAVRDITLTDWRLPRTVNAPSSLGYDTTGLTSELAYMYYINLGYAANTSHDRFTPAPTSNAYNPFFNIAYRGYWSETLSDFSDQAWILHFHFGSQELDGISDEQRVWLVMDGDVAKSVPEPGTLVLFGLGLAGIEISRRRLRS